jgi:hypothetical protein
MDKDPFLQVFVHGRHLIFYGRQVRPGLSVRIGSCLPASGLIALILQHLHRMVQS